MYEEDEELPVGTTEDEDQGILEEEELPVGTTEDDEDDQETFDDVPDGPTDLVEEPEVEDTVGRDDNEELAPDGA